MQKKLYETKVREAYYELSDKIGNAKAVLNKLDDEEISCLLKKLEEINQELINQLNNKYIWD